MKTAVVTISSRDPWESYYFKKQFDSSCKRQGITPIYLESKLYAGLMSKPKFLKAWIEKEGANWDYVISCDAWDILWLGTVDEVLRKFNALFETPIVFNAERNCFPRADLAEQHEPSKFPYRFLNSGFFVGNTEAILEMLQEMELDKVPDDHKLSDGTPVCPNDQEHYQCWYLAHKNKAQLDTGACICQSLHDSEPDEFTWDAATQRITSRITGNQPCVLHGNGSGKTWLKKVIDLAGL